MKSPPSAHKEMGKRREGDKDTGRLDPCMEISSESHQKACQFLPLVNRNGNYLTWRLQSFVSYMGRMVRLIPSIHWLLIDITHGEGY